MTTPSSVFEQIAEEVGVTPRTVRRVLSTELRDSRPTIVRRTQRIRQMAKSLGYRPHAAARATRTGRFNAVALLVGSASPRFLPAEMVHGAEMHLIEAGMHMMFASIPDTELVNAGRVPRVLEEWSVDGLLIHYTHNYPPKMLELIRAYQVPSIWANTRLDADCVYLEDRTAAQEATEQLIRLGHRRIAYVNFHRHGHYSEKDRREGYKQAMRAARLTPSVYEPDAWAGAGKLATDHRLTAARQLLESPDRPTAVLCYETSVAGPLVHAASQCGLAVPADLSLITFGRFQQNDTGVPLSTLCIPLEKAGGIAVEMLMQKIDHPEEVLPPQPVPIELSSDATLAPPFAAAP